jgi:hypothetical protein
MILGPVSNLAKVYVFKIIATLVVWCLPLIFFSESLLESAGLPSQPSVLFLRLLGWAYLSLCVGYGFGLWEELQGVRVVGPVWVGIISNGGACTTLAYFASRGSWNQWGWLVQTIGYGSIAATAVITVGLFWFGIISRKTGFLSDR